MQAGREIKFEVFDKNIPRNVEEAENNTPSGQLVPWHIVKDSDYLRDALHGKYPIRQFTGLHDKNGKEIYEGDILRYPDAYDCSTESGYDWEDTLSVGEIKWEPDYAQFTVTNRHSIDLESLFEEIEEVEVIGNIYENPDLLPAA